MTSQERILGTARELGISDELLDAIQHTSQQVKADVNNLRASELRKGLQSMRPLVDPALRRRGY